MKSICIPVILFLFYLTLVYAQDNSNIYATGTTMEVDRCASAWLIKRYVDKDAVFKFFPDGKLIKEGIPFDTPDAMLTRTHSKALFEVIIEKYGIKDKRLVRLAAHIHDIEIDFWGKQKSQDTILFEDKVRDILKNAKDNDECFAKCFILFDQYINKDVVKED